ncbi:MAG: periplasmic heavy metal sensor [Burkholderiales bacterium]
MMTVHHALSLPTRLSERLSVRLATGLLAAACLAGGAHAQAEPPMARGDHGAMAHHRGGPGGAGLMPWFGRALEAARPTPEQRAQIDTITQALQRDLRADHEAGRALHDQALALFAQPTLDPAAWDTLRKRQDEQHQRHSQRVTQAVLAAGQVLRPEQRAQLVESLKQQRVQHEQRQQRRASMKPPAPPASAPR